MPTIHWDNISHQKYGLVYRVWAYPSRKGNKWLVMYEQNGIRRYGIALWIGMGLDLKPSARYDALHRTIKKIVDEATCIYIRPHKYANLPGPGQMKPDGGGFKRFGGVDISAVFEKKCDCGAEKCGTPHVEWCSKYEK
jgi:hypothetical protein